ncbi:MAG: hypothetical protein J7551_01700 [Chloroflexi bacterium]|nr:hypothetical protein [Chloroflexota bacterium]
MLRRTLFVVGLCALLALSLRGTHDVPLRAAQATATPSLTRITISGRIVAGTDGLQLPVGAPITLHVLRSAAPDLPPAPIQQIQAPLSAEGTFRFENLALQPDDLVFASVLHSGVQQASAIVKLEAPLRDFELPITLYERTDDASVVQVLRAQHAFEFPSESAAQILSAYVLRVQGDRFFMTDQRAPNGRAISARFPLPIGAVALAFDPALGESLSVGGSAIAPEVLLTRPLFPEQTYEVIFSYQLPLSGSATLDQDYLYRTEQVEIRLPQDAATLSSEKHSFRQRLETAQGSGRAYHIYQLEQPLQAADRLIFTLSRQLPPTPQPRRGASAPEDTTWFAVLVLGLTLLGALSGAIWLARRLMQLMQR